jgi:hypothetical protein
VSIALLIAGMLLCFVGVRSLVLAAACAGFGLGSGLATWVESLVALVALVALLVLAWTGFTTQRRRMDQT